MKQCILIVLLSVLIQKVHAQSSFPINISPNISVRFPFSVDTLKDGNMTFFVLFNDSFNCSASIVESTDTVEIKMDSISKIKGIDANLFQYAQSQMGYDLTAKRDTVFNLPVYTFDYLSALGNQRMLHRGTLFYYQNNMVVIEFSNDQKRQNDVDFLRAQFLGSLQIKNYKK